MKHFRPESSAMLYVCPWYPVHPRNGNSLRDDADAWCQGVHMGEDADSSRLFFNGRVLTLDAARPEARWVRVEGGVVRELGAGEPLERAAIGSELRYDLRGRTLLPAFCDAHVHLTWLATAELGHDLADCGSVEAVLEALVAARTSGRGRGPGGEWIVGHGMDESVWPERRLPTRSEIDR